MATRNPGGGREAWMTLAAVAAATDGVRIGTLVTCTRYRNPVLLAHMAETVDEISGGRLILGLGAGDYGTEHERMGIDRDRPIAHFEEALAIVVPLLRTGRSTSTAGPIGPTPSSGLERPADPAHRC